MEDPRNWRAEYGPGAESVEHGFRGVWVLVNRTTGEMKRRLTVRVAANPLQSALDAFAEVEAWNEVAEKLGITPLP